MRLLIADDSRAMRLLLSSLLKQIGYHDLIEAENGQIALDRVQAGGIDTLLLDLHMPVLDGLATLRRLQESPAIAGLPVLIVSSDSDMRNVEEARKLGAIGYIRKPFTPQGLKKGLEAALSMISARRGPRS